MRKLKRLVAKYRMKQAGMPKVNKAMRWYWREFLAHPEKKVARVRRRFS